MLERDLDAFLADVDPAATDLRRRQTELFAALEEVPLGTWQYVLDDRTAEPDDVQLDARYGTGRWWAPDVSLQHSIAGYDTRPTIDAQHLTFVERDGRWLLAADDDFKAVGRDTTRLLWDLGPVVAERRDEVLVLGRPDDRSLLRDVARQAAAAVPRVSRVWGDQWRRGLVVLVPGSAREMDLLLDGDGDLSQIAAVATAELSGGEEFDPAGDRVLVNPRTSPARRARPAGRAHPRGHPRREPARDRAAASRPGSSRAWPTTSLPRRRRAARGLGARAAGRRPRRPAAGRAARGARTSTARTPACRGVRAGAGWPCDARRPVRPGEGAALLPRDRRAARAARTAPSRGLLGSRARHDDRRVVRDWRRALQRAARVSRGRRSSSRSPCLLAVLASRCAVLAAGRRCPAPTGADVGARLHPCRARPRGRLPRRGATAGVRLARPRPRRGRGARPHAARAPGWCAVARPLGGGWLRRSSSARWRRGRRPARHAAARRPRRAGAARVRPVDARPGQAGRSTSCRGVAGRRRC